ncbi:MAG: adenylosuccinate lyase [Dehalococcoidales bacterium]|nr:adenylosuccinate lyase [Dehalococcoidales bacterium]MDD3265380.1 adenylosuccinate lyase [Dehalococcoidales bacterium]MDD4322327.1 adenylosuccinate lyase [Dehalococcoidales bacterium]MDD4793955.1 adenylosuccinate lyase [Dehalococcoidales bacterium]MDD5122476.1 adenylosuccinate lyase [Dehalococcoidales bacterium]
MIERYCRPQMKEVWSDANKYSKWLEVEIAVCEAWSEIGRVPRNSIPKIKMARLDMKRMAEILQQTHHDMTAFLGSIAESIGPESRFIHLGLTSNDVMDTALSLQMVEAANLLNEGVKDIINILAEKAIEHKYTIMMGRTHGIHAEPITFGLKLALWMEEMKRHRQRLADATRIISVGKISGAVGTYANVPPEVEEKACCKLGLSPSPISNQILQRDRHAQFLTTIALVACSLEKFATEIRALQKTEFHEAEEPFAPGQTGSSSMPHKRNPELCERISGLARLIRGYSLTSMENVALWHERDISHSSTERVILPDSCLLLDYMMGLFSGIMSGLKVFPENMKRNMEITKGLLFSQRVMLALIDKGLTRQQAYEVVQTNAMKSWQGRSKFITLLKKDPQASKVFKEEEIDQLFDYDYYVKHVDDIFKRLGLTRTQWKKRPQTSAGNNLAPGAI